jgi:hypothetical protein
MLSSSFRCDQIYKYELHDFGHFVVLLKSDLDVQWTHLRLVFTGQTSGLYYKCFTIVIYNCNERGQYYKTTIMIVIDGPS